MMPKTDLFLHEQLMLLSLKEKEGTLVSGTTYQFGLGGAILAELLMSERIAVESKAKRPKVQIVNSEPLGDPLLDEWLGKMIGAKRPKSMQDWVTRVANMRELKHRVARQLSRRGILRTDEDKVLWIFTRKIYPEVEPGPERELMGMLESVLFDGAPPPPRVAVLIALAHHSGVLGAVFDKKRLREKKDWIEQISDGSETAAATKDAIQAMHAAVMVATMVTTT